MCSAASCNDLQLLKAWEAAGADLNSSDYDKRTALHVASSLGHADMVKYLLESNADPFAVDSCGHNCLDKALIGRHAKIVNMIRLHMEKLAK
ncbi:unnamed protein product [Soboliphyme baturini]|uniref:ANK_REP_REGION domain-containing protein n=1 Tax=Soboliphyme baturini TaxID=241478 RepID=A0A183IWX9_9BILA|nr:unnamed protein product [Soboliphyme baturini]